jgi:hypothetical protein
MKRRTTRKVYHGKPVLRNYEIALFPDKKIKTRRQKVAAGVIGKNPIIQKLLTCR